MPFRSCLAVPIRPAFLSPAVRLRRKASVLGWGCKPSECAILASVNRNSNQKQVTAITVVAGSPASPTNCDQPCSSLSNNHCPVVFATRHICCDVVRELNDTGSVLSTSNVVQEAQASSSAHVAAKAAQDTHISALQVVHHHVTLHTPTMSRSPIPGICRADSITHQKLQKPSCIPMWLLPQYVHQRPREAVVCES